MWVGAGLGQGLGLGLGLGRAGAGLKVGWTGARLGYTVLGQGWAGPAGGQG